MFATSKFSRLLVYKDDIDNIVGVLHIKDFYTKDGITDKSVEEIMTTPIFIHKTEKASSLLKRLQTEKSHIAVVLDEFGGTLGIVTMEDILEELVGEIWDEHDDVLEDFKQVGEGEYLVNCDMSMDDFCNFFDVKTDSDSSTLNGWIAEKLDKVPEKDDNFLFENLDITVTETDAHRVMSALVKVTAPTDKEEEQKSDDKRTE